MQALLQIETSIKLIRTVVPEHDLILHEQFSEELHKAGYFLIVGIALSLQTF
jgi:hypothetical protein